MNNIYFWIYITSALFILIPVTIEKVYVNKISEENNLDYVEAYKKLLIDSDLYKTKKDDVEEVIYFIDSLDFSQANFIIFIFPCIMALLPVFNTFYIIISLFYKNHNQG